MTVAPQAAASAVRAVPLPPGGHDATLMEEDLSRATPPSLASFAAAAAAGAPSDASPVAPPPPGSDDTPTGGPDTWSVLMPPVLQQQARLRQRFEGGLLGGLPADLVALGLVPERKAVSLALKAREAGQTFLRTLALEANAATAESVFTHVAQTLGTELIRRRVDLLDRVETLPWLPMQLAEQRGVLALRSPQGEAQRYVALDPCDPLTRDWVERRAGREAQPLAVLPEAFFEALGRLKAERSDGPLGDRLLIPIDIDFERQEQIKQGLVDADVPLIVDYLLHRANEQGASDIHVEPTDEGMVVRTRVDGILAEEARLPIALHPPVTSRIKVLAGMDVAERRRPQDGRITALIQKAPLDIRVSTLPTVRGEKCVLRLLDEKALRPSPEKLGLRESYLHLLLDKISAPHGLVMISGPTGSGKTTTLYSCLSAIDRVRRNVVTIEDPVEYRLRGVHQIQVNERIGLTFATGLRTILRQDPNVIMVGECRDRETTEIAVQAARTGHVVLSTIHTNDAPSVVSRLLDMGIDPYRVATSLALPVAQRLVRKVCESCRTTVSGTELLTLLRGDGFSDRKLARLGININPRMTAVHAPGCPNCRHTGYAGRQPVFEMFPITEPIRDLIMSANFNSDALRRLARQEGMTTMVEEALKLVEEGRTTYAEVLRVLGEEG